MPPSDPPDPPAFHLTITNRQALLPLDIPKLQGILKQVLRQEQVVEAEITVLIVDNPTIWRMNRRYLQHDYPTDALSFLLERTPPLAEQAPVPRGVGSVLSGEVVVSAEMAMQVAAEYDWPPEHELALYAVHGVLHLCGYDDTTAPERELMRTREIQLLHPWGIHPPGRSPTEDSSEESDTAAPGAPRS